jgi:hypothetical protein
VEAGGIASVLVAAKQLRSEHAGATGAEREYRMRLPKRLRARAGNSVLFGMQSRTMGPYSVGINRTHCMRLPKRLRAQAGNPKKA